jgi:CHAT domain-containing protein/Flp pilus assembly protein TadD
MFILLCCACESAHVIEIRANGSRSWQNRTQQFEYILPIDNGLTESLWRGCESNIESNQFMTALDTCKMARKRVEEFFGIESAEAIFLIRKEAMVMMELGRYSESSSALRSLLIRLEQSTKDTEIERADAMADLGRLEIRLGQYSDAERRLNDSLKIYKSHKSFQDIAAVINDLGSLSLSLGRYVEAESHFIDSIELLTKLESSEIIHAWNNLAISTFLSHNFDKAALMLAQILSLQRLVMPNDRPGIAAILNNHAVLFRQLGKYTEARKSIEASLMLLISLYGVEHPSVAHAQTLLAMIYREEGGRWDEAERLLERSAEIIERTMGPDHPSLISTLLQIAQLPSSQYQIHKSTALLRRVIRIRDAQFRTMTSEVGMEALVHSSRVEEELVYAQLLFNFHSVQEARLALTTSFLRKGRVAEAGQNANRLLHQHIADKNIEKLYFEWLEARKSLEKHISQGLMDLTPLKYREKLSDLQTHANRLETQLANSLPSLGRFHPPDFEHIVSQVAAQIPPDDLFIEIVQAKTLATVRNTLTVTNDSNYVALLLFSNEQVISVDLGRTSEIDPMIQRFLADLKSHKSDPRVAAHELYLRIIHPLLIYLGGKKNLFLSLDGMLHLVPFDALYDGVDYLLGRYRFHYVTSGRDLLRKPSTNKPRDSIVMADPDFGKSSVNAVQGKHLSIYQRLPNLNRLPGALGEARVIGRFLNVFPLVDKSAREEVLHSARSPMILHIATHALFRADVEPDIQAHNRSALLLPVPGHSAINSAPTVQPVELLPSTLSPMVRSALLLAGVLDGDQAPNTDMDGLLTAQEARSLALDGTQLVVLSACETGIGLVRSGQGVHGLRHAFLIAGTETLVTSLWRVDDNATGMLMHRYYEKLLDPTKPGDRLGAMVEAMQDLRNSSDYSHPFYWAPFLVIGQSGPLRKQLSP